MDWSFTAFHLVILFYFFKLFLYVINSNIYIPLTIRTNITYSTLETTKEREIENSHIYILYPAKYKEK